MDPRSRTLRLLSIIKEQAIAAEQEHERFRQLVDILTEELASKDPASFEPNPTKGIPMSKSASREFSSSPKTVPDQHVTDTDRETLRAKFVEKRVETSNTKDILKTFHGLNGSNAVLGSAAENRLMVPEAYTLGNNKRYSKSDGSLLGSRHEVFTAQTDDSSGISFQARHISSDDLVSRLPPDSVQLPLLKIRFKPQTNYLLPPSLIDSDSFRREFGDGGVPTSSGVESSRGECPAADQTSSKCSENRRLHFQTDLPEKATTEESPLIYKAATHSFLESIPADPLGSVNISGNYSSVVRGQMGNVCSGEEGSKAAFDCNMSRLSKLGVMLPRKSRHQNGGDVLAWLDDVGIPEKSTTSWRLESLSVAPRKKINDGTCYDKSLQIASSGDCVQLFILDVKSDIPVISAWINNRQTAEYPVAVKKMGSHLNAFYCSAQRLKPDFRPLAGQFVAVCSGAAWFRGKVQSWQKTHVIVEKIDVGGVVRLPCPSMDVQPLHEEFEDMKPLAWHAFIAGVDPAIYDSQTSCHLQNMLIGHSKTATLISLHPTPVIRIFDSVPCYRRPVDITTLLLRNILQQKRAVVRLGIIIHVPRYCDMYQFLMVDISDMRKFETLQIRVQEEYGEKLSSWGDLDRVVAVNHKGVFYRAFFSQGPEKDDQVKLELMDYGNIITAHKTELYELPDKLRYEKPCSVMCTLEERDVKDNGWNNLAACLKTMLHKVIAYQIIQTSSLDRLIVRVWTEDMQCLSVCGPKRFSRNLMIKELISGETFGVGETISVIPVHVFPSGEISVKVPIAFEPSEAEGEVLAYGLGSEEDIKKNADSVLCEIEYDMACECPKSPGYDEIPKPGTLVSALSSGSWCRGVVIRSSSFPDKAFVHFVDYGDLEMVPLKNLRHLYPEWVRTPRRTVLVSLEDLVSNGPSCDSESFPALLAQLEQTVIARVCRLKITEVDGLYLRGILGL